MLAEIKRLKIEELKKKIEEKEIVIRSVKEEREKIVALYSALADISSILERYDILQLPIDSDNYKETESKLKDIKSKLKELGFNPDNYILDDWGDSPFLTFDNEKARLEKEKERIEEEITKIEKYSSLSDFNMNFNQACTFLGENGVPIILSEEDKSIRTNNVDYNNLSDFILVHKTNFLPRNNRILTTKNSGAEFTKEVDLDTSRSIEYSSGRNTIHFSVNSEVSEHSTGNDWNKCPYAVLIPFEDMPLNQLRSAMPVDTFFYGDIELPNSTIILCPIEQLKDASSSNPGLTVIGYNGPNVMGYTNAMISMMGKKAEQADMWSWVDKEANKKYNEIVESLGFNVTPHIATPERIEERDQENINKFIELMKIIQDNNLINTPNDILEVYKRMNSDILYIPENRIRKISERLSEIGITLPNDVIEHIEYITNDIRNFYDEIYVNSFLQTHQDISEYVDYNRVMRHNGRIYNYAPDVIVVSALNKILENYQKIENEGKIDSRRVS